MPVTMHSSEFSEKLLVQAFPFHLVVSTSGEILSCGKSLDRIIQFQKVGRNDLFEYFNIQHPLSIVDAGQLVDKEDKLFLLASKQNTDLLLRGQLVIDSEKHHFIFLISPWVTDIDVLEKLGLTLQDLPVHSSLSDFLLLIQSQRVSLNDSVRLSDELTHLNKELEERVANRTADLQLKAEELSESKSVLEHEMNERERVEVELRHAQKLEAVGQLAAGIAHEINTPLQYVGSSLSFLQESTADLSVLNTLLNDCLSQDKYCLDPTIVRLQQTLDDIDLSYICKRAPMALDRALSGITRVTEIVGAMNEFTHPDKTEMVGADVNRALDTVLTVAISEYKYVATIERDFAELPMVRCFLGNLNQVFLNIIVNAAYAICDAQIEHGVIKVSTKLDNNTVVVSISDNGTGIPHAIQHRIFDPFFTTKEVGKGTGQGLSISHSIVVDKHGGQLTFDTESGKGTTFHIVLPLLGKTLQGSTHDSTVEGNLAA